jgi:hypothetical protein
VGWHSFMAEDGYRFHYRFCAASPLVAPVLSEWLYMMLCTGAGVEPPADRQQAPDQANEEVDAGLARGRRDGTPPRLPDSGRECPDY